MYDNESSFRWRSERRSSGNFAEDLNDVEVTTLNAKGYLINALMERDIKSIKRLGPIDSDEIDYILQVNSCFVPILYLTKMLSFNEYTSSQLLQIAKKCVDLGVDNVFMTVGDKMSVEHRKQLVQHCLMVEPNILSFFSFDEELLPVHSPPLTVIVNSSADKRRLLSMWLDSEYWNGDIGKHLAINQEDLLTGDSVREKYIRDEPIRVETYKDIVDLLRLADNNYYYRSTSELRLKSVSVEKAVYYNKKTETEIEVPMCPCNLESIIKYHPKVKLLDPKDVYIILLKYSRLDALEILHQAGHNFNQLTIDFDLNIHSYDFLLSKVKMEDSWRLHRGCRSLVSMFVKHYPKMMVDENDIKDFPHHCMDLMSEPVVNKMLKSRHYHSLVSRALREGNTFPYRLLSAKDRDRFKMDVLISGDIGLSKDFVYTSEEIKENIRKIKAQTIAYYINILKETVESDSRALLARGDYYINLYINNMES